MKRKKAPIDQRVVLLLRTAVAYAACTALVFFVLYRLLRRYSGRPGWVLLGGWVAILVLMGLLGYRMFSRRNVQEKLTQSELEHANRHMREIQLQKRKEQLNALQNQINPYFLYNTLDTLRGLAIEREAMDVADIVATLSSMFKYSMDYANSLVPVSDEIEHLKSFLKIQAIRFPRKFTFEQITECEFRELHEVQIPKLVLQPIVENVFTHAFKKTLTGGRVTLRLTATDVDFQIQVSDNGAGIGDEQVLALNRMFGGAQDAERPMDGEHSSIALYNIDSRIKMYCGERYGLHITSTVDYGTTVTISLPCPL